MYIKNYEQRPLKCNSLDEKEESKLTADIVNDFIKQSNEILANNQVNINNPVRYSDDQTK